MSDTLRESRHRAVTFDGWELALKRTVDDGRLDRSRKPIAIIPGYGMNTFILGYHPTGRSMEAYLASRGFEVWSADLRGQGTSRHPSGTGDFRLQDLIFTDLLAVLDAIAERTESRQRTIHTIGCSLGGSLLFAHVACRASTRVGSIAALGAPLRWEKIHPLLRLVFGSRTVAGLLPNKGNRRMAGFVLPLALKVPRSLHIYMHPEISDTSDYRTLLNSVEDTSRSLNRQMADWIRTKDLVLDGCNTSVGVRRADIPLLCVVANADGVVPAETALSAYEEWGCDDKEVLVVGDTRRRFAHADLFISNFSEELVFRPLADWFEHR